MTVFFLFYTTNKRVHTTDVIYSRLTINLMLHIMIFVLLKNICRFFCSF